MQVTPPSPDTLALIGKAVEIAVLGVLAWIAKTTHANSRELLTLRIVLTGEDGKNGIKGTTAELRKRTHHLGQIVDWVSNRTYDLEQIEGIEARPMPRPASE